MDHTKVQTFLLLMDHLELYSKLYQLQIDQECVDHENLNYYLGKIDEARSSLFNLAFKQED